MLEAVAVAALKVCATRGICDSLEAGRGRGRAVHSQPSHGGQQRGQRAGVEPSAEFYAIPYPIPPRMTPARVDHSITGAQRPIIVKMDGYTKPCKQFHFAYFLEME